MKWVSILLLAVFTVIVLAPVAWFSVASAGSGHPTLGALDVCNAATPALAAHGEMPCVTVSACVAAPLFSQAAFEPFQHGLTELILAPRIEQPPQS